MLPMSQSFMTGTGYLSRKARYPILTICRPKRTAVAALLCGLLSWNVVSAAPAITSRDRLFNVQRFVQAPSGGSSILVEDPAVLPHLTAGLSYMVTWADRPLQLTGKATQPKPWVESLAAQTIVGSVGLFDRFQLSFALPYTIYESCGKTTVSTGSDGETADLCWAERDGAVSENYFGSGFNDLILSFKGAVLSNRKEGFGVSFALDLGLPIDTGGPYRGSTNLPNELAEGSRDAGENDFQVTVTPRLMFGYATPNIRLAAEVGVRFQRELVYLPEDDKLNVGNELLGGLAASWHFASSLTAVAELWGATLVDFSGGAIETPIEALAAVRWRTPWPIALVLGGGVGVVRGYGAARERFFAGLSYDFAMRAADADGDGVVDEKDECVGRAEDRDGFFDDDGCPDPDNDGDGVPDVRDRCPNIYGGSPSGCPG